MSFKTRYLGDKQFYKKVLAVAVPIMLQNGITNFVSMLDNIMVGQVGTVEMTGVAVANQLMFVFTLCLFGAVSGAGIFGAQFYGRGDQDGMRYSFRFKILVCGAITVAAGLVFYFWGGPLSGLFLEGEGAVEDAAASLRYAEQYIRIMLIGLIPTAFIQSYSATLRETGETRLPMRAGLIAVCVNLVFNYLLIFGNLGFPCLGVQGAAIATVISRFVEAGIVVIWTHRHTAEYPFVKGLWKSMRIPGDLMASMAGKGLPLMVNEALWSIGMTVLIRCYSLRGLEVVAAVNISTTFWNVFSVSFMAIGTSIGIIVGQLLGADKFEEVKDTTRKLIAFALAGSVVVGAMYAVIAQFVPLIYNTTPAVREMATQFMVVGACTAPIVSFVHAAYFTLRSGGKTLVTFCFDSCFVWVVAVPLATGLVNYTDLPILPLYIIVQAADIIKATIGYILLKKGVWIRNIVG